MYTNTDGESCMLVPGDITDITTDSRTSKMVKTQSCSMTAFTAKMKA